VVQSAEQDMFITGKSKQPGAKRRARIQIERRANLLSRKGVKLGFPVVVWSVTQVRDGEFHDEFRHNQLDRLAMLNVKSGTEDFMTIHDFLNTQLKRVLTKIPLQPQADCQVKG
jgi:hypothetical protein